MNAISHAWIDGGALRTYRHAPNTGSRKSWAAGDACRRAVQLALWSRRGEMGYATAMTAPQWGFQDVLFKGESVELARELGTYVMENILFKVKFPAEFHAQTAVEAAIQLHPQVCDRIDDIQSVRIETQESAVRIIDKKGPLNNPADRDHCLQYMTAVGLLQGELKAEHYEDSFAADPRIDALREKMEVVENERFTREYLDPDKRSIGNSVQVTFHGRNTDRIRFRRLPCRPPFPPRRGTSTTGRKVSGESGHTIFLKRKTNALMALMTDATKLTSLRVDEFVTQFELG